MSKRVVKSRKKVRNKLMEQPLNLGQKNRIWKPLLILLKENQKKSYAHRNTQFGGTKKVVKISLYEATAQSHILFISVIIFLLNCICILKAFGLLGNVSLYRVPGYHSQQCNLTQISTFSTYFPRAPISSAISPRSCSIHLS